MQREEGGTETSIEEVDWVRLARLERGEPAEPLQVLADKVVPFRCAVGPDDVDIWQYRSESTSMYLPPFRKYSVVMAVSSTGPCIVGMAGKAVGSRRDGGEILVTPPGVATYIRNFGEKRCLVINFPQSFIDGHFHNRPEPTSLRPDFRTCDAVLKSFGQGLLEHLSLESVDAWRVREHAVKAITTHLLNLQSETTDPESTPLTPAQLRAVREVVLSRPDARPPLDEVAAMLGLLPARFAKLFKATTNESLPDFAHRVRMQRARELIETTQRPISDVALDLGYYDNAHLTRLFRRFWGVPPSVLRSRRSAR